MIDLQGKQIYVYTAPVDMRKAVNGLSIILQETFDKNPQSGDLYIFANRSRNKLKCLFWDRNGFVLYYKRLERGRFNYSKNLTEESLIVDEPQLQALLMGLDFHLLGNFDAERYESFF